MRALTYYVGCTVDGFIAAPARSFDAFLTQGEHFADLFAEYPGTLPLHLRGHFGVPADAPNRHFDTVLMGRSTYEVGIPLGVTSPYAHMRQYVFSRTMREPPDPAVQLVGGNALDVVRQLKREPAGKAPLLCGGGAASGGVFSSIAAHVVQA